MRELDIQSFKDELRYYVNDDALRDMLRHRDPELIAMMAAISAHNPKPKTRTQEAVAPCPPLSDLTAIQATLWDNWPHGKKPKGKPNRYAVTIEAWTAGADDLATDQPQWRKTGDLIPSSMIVQEADRLHAKIKKDGSGPTISDDYHDLLIALAETSLPVESYVALLRAKRPGTAYFDCQFVCLAFNGPHVTEGVFFLHGEWITLSQFATTTAKGNPLPAAKNGKGKALLQSRNDLCGFANQWDTSAKIS